VRRRTAAALRLMRGLFRSEAATDPEAADPRLRGRAYDLPYRRVWTAALAIARAERDWTVVAADPRAGEIRAEARAVLWRGVDDVHVRIALDPLGRTRVDLHSCSRARRGDLGTNARRIGRFLRALDRALAPA
jgi:hypothetical protein